MLGDALSAISPIEYEERMDYAFDTRFHHLGAYLISWPVARREVDTDVEHILSSRGRRTVYLYNVGPDALQHTRGAIAPYLDHLDAKLTELQSRYRARTGRALEIVVLSDHGHNRGLDAHFVPITEALAAHGFTAARAVTAPNQIAFGVDGVTTGFGVFTYPDSVQRMAALLADAPGVEPVTRRQSASLFVVERIIRTPVGGVGRTEGRVMWRVVTTAHSSRMRPSVAIRCPWRRCSRVCERTACSMPTGLPRRTFGRATPQPRRICRGRAHRARASQCRQESGAHPRVTR